MVSVITRTLWLNLLTSSGFVAMCLIALQVVFTLLGESGALRKEYGFADSIIYSLLISGPGSLVFILPIVMLIATLLVLGRMADNSELVVLRSAGLSRLNIFGKLLPVVLLISTTVMILEDTAFLPLRNYAIDMRNELRDLKPDDTGSLALKLDDRFLVAESISSTGKLKRVHVFIFDDRFRLNSQIVAETGTATDNLIVLDKPLVSHYGQVGNNEVSSKRVENMEIKTPHSLDFMKWLSLSKLSDTARLSFAELWEFSDYQKSLNPNNNQFSQVFYNKLMLPLNILAFMMLVFPFVFGNNRNTNTSTKVIVAIMIGLVFVNLQQLTLPLHIVFGIAPFFVSMAPAILTFAIAFCLIMMQRN